MCSDDSTIEDGAAAPDALQSLIEKHWGFRELRPLQAEAMQAVLEGRDSLVVMPTGGGKSLCYQAPAIVRAAQGRGPTVVVSPLIALMKDQVDALRANGIEAAQLDSSLSGSERAGVENDLREGVLRLLFVSPERMAMTGFQQLLREVGVHCFAIDEAHCISHWGHDFRPEYRQLAQLKELFPGAAVHGFTATATESVRADIIEQLNLRDPEILVGNFDRPNLTYRVVARHNLMAQVQEVLARHKNEAGIIYCIRRKDVEELTAELQGCGHKAQAYHAGMTQDKRRKTQEAFKNEDCDLIVATVAFGMGIDRSNLRFVLHTATPKSLEAYQQETGRAGRDGLEAECILLYSGSDIMLWKSIVERSAAEAVAAGQDIDPIYVPTAMRHLEDMDRYCRGAVCRHQALVEYFGQTYVPPAAIVEGDQGVEAVWDGELAGEGSCHACDVCLGDIERVADGLIVAQKILSAVARVQERFGAGHVISVLRGENTERVRALGHDKLPTYGLLKEHDKSQLRDFIFQLIGQKVLVLEGQEYPILRLNPASWEVMKKQRDVRLIQTRKKKSEKKSRGETVSWEGVDRELFEALRGLRHQLATTRGVPPYVIFSDATLRELARLRPSTLAGMRQVYGIGETKLRDFGSQVLPLIKGHCRDHQVALDQMPTPDAKIIVKPRPQTAAPAAKPPRPNALKNQAFAMFSSGAALDDVAAATQRSRGTIAEYLCEFIETQRPQSVGPWVSERTYRQVLEAARREGNLRLRPIYVALNETVDYDTIRIVVTHAAAVG